MIQIQKVCERIEQDTLSRDTDSETHFKLRLPPPTVDDLQNHNVTEHMDLYLPYLTYYATAFKSDDPGFSDTRKYIQQILSDYWAAHPGKKR